MSQSSLLGVALALSLVIMLLGTPLSAHEFTHLDEGFPTELEDAYGVGHTYSEFQFGSRYVLTSDGGDHALSYPGVEFGFAPYWQAKLSYPVRFGSGDIEDNRNLGTELFRQFLQESDRAPAIAGSLGVLLPSGTGANGVDPTVKLLVSKTVRRDAAVPRLHANVLYTFNTDRQPGERSGLWSAIGGWGRLIGGKTLLVADLVGEQDFEEDNTVYLFELGIRRHFRRNATISTGVAFGLNSDSPSFQFTLGYQTLFGSIPQE